MLLFAFFYSCSLSYSQECELSIQTPPFAYSEYMPTSSGIGSYDLEVNFDGLSCHGGSGEWCICECYLAIHFNPVDPTFLATYPNAFDVVDLSVQSNQQSISGLTPPTSLGYYADANVLVVSLGSNINTAAGTLLIDFPQDPSAATSVALIEGICVIDNIDKPFSETRDNIVLDHFGLNDLELVDDPRTIPE